MNCTRPTPKFEKADGCVSDLLAVSRFIRELQGVKNGQNQPLLDRVEVVFNTDPGLEAPKETKALEGIKLVF